jgi:Tfp pilus assembly protein PilX
VQQPFRASTKQRGAVLGRRSRRGAALLLVVIAVVASTMVTAALAQAALRQRRQLQYERDRSQAFWLLESGVQRAAAKLARDPRYAGEFWQPEAPGSGEPQAAAVTIRVSPAEAAGMAVVNVVSEFPAGAVHRTRLHREFTISLSTPSTAGDISASALFPENVVP